jgi:hypothetical protein
MSAFKHDEDDGAEDGLDDAAGTGGLLGSKKAVATAMMPAAPGPRR